MEVLGVRSIHVAIVIGVALTSPGQKMQGNQERVGDFSKQSDCPDSGYYYHTTSRLPNMPGGSRPDFRYDISRSKFDKWRFLAYNPGKLELEVTIKIYLGRSIRDE